MRCRYMTIHPGGKGYLWRTVNTDSIPSLERQLLTAQVPVIQIEELDREAQRTRKRVRLNDLCNYTEQMETGYALGMPLLRMLSSCIECTGSLSLKAVLSAIRMEVERGKGLAAAMAQWPQVFSSIYISFVATGEQGSGRMDQAFTQIKTMLLRNQVIRGKIRSVMMMPIVTLIMLILVLAFMMTAIVPKFQSMFAATGTALPLPTQVLVSISDLLRAHPFLAGLGGVVTVIALIRSSSLFSNFPKLHGVALRIPVYGKLQRKVMIANFSRTLGQLINSGVPFVQALYLTRDLSSNVIYRLAIARAIISVSKGEKIAKALTPVKAIFGPELLHQMAFGEETGAIPQLLKTLTERQDRELLAFVDDMKPVLEGIMIAVMAALVGAVIVALYLPIFNMGQTLTGNH